MPTKMILLGCGRYKKAHDWVFQSNGGNQVVVMSSFRAADRTIRELCPEIHSSSMAPLVDAGPAGAARITSYFDKDGLVGLVVDEVELVLDNERP